MTHPPHTATTGTPQILRAKWHDYRAKGFYMITFTTEGRKRLLGTLIGTSEDDAHVVLTPLGQYLNQEILTISNTFPEIEIIEHIIMTIIKSFG